MPVLIPLEALQALRQSLQSKHEGTNVYVVDSDPYEGYDPEGVHLVVAVDLTPSEIDDFIEDVAREVEATNVQLDFEPFLIAHTTQKGTPLCKWAREEGRHVR